MIFQATLELNGKTATGIRVPAEIVAALGAGKKPAVRVTINGYTYRSTVAVYGGEFFLPVSAEVRAGAGIAAEDEIEVAVELDTEPREVVVPPDLSSALEADPEARRFFDGLSYSNKRRIVLGIDDAKTPETRRRRIDKAIERLRQGLV